MLIPYTPYPMEGDGAFAVASIPSVHRENMSLLSAFLSKMLQPALEYLTYTQNPFPKSAFTITITLP